MKSDENHYVGLRQLIILSLKISDDYKSSILG